MILSDGQKSDSLWIAVEETDLDALKKLVSQFCSRLGQEAMYFEVTDAKIEFIKPESDQGSNHG